MKLIVDGEEAVLAADETKDLGALLQELDQSLRHAGRIVCEVRCDGDSVAPERVADTLERAAADGVETLEIVTAPSGPMVLSIVESMEAAAPELPFICLELARLFHAEEPQQAYEAFNAFATHWEEMKRLQMQALNALCVVPGEVRVGDVSAEELHRSLNQHLKAAVEALKQQDSIALGDILQHDLAPLAEQEAAFVAWLREAAERT